MFAYGQTGSGKTYTMEGGPGIAEDVEQSGVIPRTIRQIFEIKKQLTEKNWEYKLHVSFTILPTFPLNFTFRLLFWKFTMKRLRIS